MHVCLNCYYCYLYDYCGKTFKENINNFIDDIPYILKKCVDVRNNKKCKYYKRSWFSKHIDFKYKVKYKYNHCQICKNFDKTFIKCYYPTSQMNYVIGEVKYIITSCYHNYNGKCKKFKRIEKLPPCGGEDI